ncbi:hypothetical protein ABKY54_004530 [Vibrio harveyi]
MKLYCINGDIVSLNHIQIVIVAGFSCMLQFSESSKHVFTFSKEAEAQAMRNEIYKAMIEPEENMTYISDLKPL